MQISQPARRILLCSLLMGIEALSGCIIRPHERLVYNEQGIQIGVEADPTVSRSKHQALNNHPSDITPAEIQSLLQVVQVSGWSGTIVGLVGSPAPVPLFTAKELSTIAGHLANAFHEAKTTERVLFSLPKPDVAYSEDRTAGFLFFRGRYLHVVVTDHSSILTADTAGGDLKDIRDTKGMKLWVAGPAQAAIVPDPDEPLWATFETVHLSLNVKEVLALQAKTPPVRFSREGPVFPFSGPSSSLPKSGQVGVSTEDMQLQIRELTSSNLELRGRLEEQNRRMEQLNSQLEQLRSELDKAKSKTQPSRKVPAQ